MGIDMSNQEHTLDQLRRVGALITGSHIVYTSGRHGTAYINKDALYPYTSIVDDLTGRMAFGFSHDDVEVVVGPEKGGIILSQWVAHHLQSFNARARSDSPEVLSVYAEKEGGEFAFRRGYELLVPNKRVLVVEDVLTTGSSVLKVVNAVRSLGGEVIGVAALCNRGGVTVGDIGNVPKLFSCAEFKLDSWNEDQCPMCAQGIPINTEVGKGREFLARRDMK